MFLIIYLRRELRRRKRQAVVIALGLAVGIGLVITVSAATTGVADAQRAVLHSLYGIGTDITVTSPQQNDSSGSGLFRPGDQPQHEDFLRPPPGLGVLDASGVAAIRHLHGVAATAGGLDLFATKLTVPAADQQGGKLPQPTRFTVHGQDLSQQKLGPYGSTRIAAGRQFTAADATANVAEVDSHYASANNLRVGVTITIAKTTFTVIGLVDQPQNAGAANVYLPLARAQALTAYQGLDSLAGKVSTIYVVAASATDIPAVHAAIAHRLPAATVTSSADLAKRVSGSLASASSLAVDLGRWVAIAVLLAAFATASLLTVAAVSRRVREFGTLKALGWRTRRIVAQVMAESAAVGAIGAVLGIALGLGSARVIGLIAPKLSATVAQNPGSEPPQGALINGGSIRKVPLSGGSHTVAVHLHAPVGVATIGLAVALALAGALIAGSLGAWRAARLRPTAALSRVA